MIKRKQTDRYPVAVPRMPFGDPPRHRVPPIVDVPIAVLDTGETPRERERRLTLARSRFVADEQARSRARDVSRGREQAQRDASREQEIDP